MLYLIALPDGNEAHGIVHCPVLLQEKYVKADRSLSALEQACERLAIMAYEVFSRKIAYGLKSITYSYISGLSGHYDFTAIFTPFCNEEEDVVILHLNAIPVCGVTDGWSIGRGKIGYRRNVAEDTMFSIDFRDEEGMVISSSSGDLVFIGNSWRRVIDSSTLVSI